MKEMLIVSSPKDSPIFNHNFTIDAIVKADGRTIDDKRILVDRELGRTKREWLPRRLGGGKGELRRNREEEREMADMKKQILRE